MVGETIGGSERLSGGQGDCGEVRKTIGGQGHCGEVKETVGRSGRLCGGQG